MSVLILVKQTTKFPEMVVCQSAEINAFHPPAFRPMFTIEGSHTKLVCLYISFTRQ